MIMIHREILTEEFSMTLKSHLADRALIVLRRQPRSILDESYAELTL